MVIDRIAKLEQLLKRKSIIKIDGADIHESAGGSVITIPPAFILGKITAQTIQGSAYIWKYTVVPVVVDGIGDVNVAGSSSYAYNLTELNNPSDGTGLHGNGVDNSAASWPDGYDIIPCPIDTVVMLWPIQSITGIKYIFSYANGVDGLC